MHCFAVDFDGVLCDSAAETGVSAWRAGAGLWSDWRGPEPPTDALARFVALRPALETGYQAVLLMKLACEGLTLGDVLPRAEHLYARTSADAGVTRDELVARFGAARDAWIRDDLDDWLSRHRFYPGTVARFAACQAEGRAWILTTKQERFARLLLERAGVRMPPDRLYGLDRGRSKEDILASLLAAHAGDRLRFIEDRLPTLQRVLARPELAGVQCEYAPWGYGTEADLAVAERTPRIRVLTPASFLVPGS